MKTFAISAAITAGLASFAASASAQSLYFVNSPLTTLSSVGSQVFNAKFRISSAASTNGYDQSFAIGTSNSVSSTTLTSSNTLAIALPGGTPAGGINSRVYTFTLEHRTNQGYIFTLASGSTNTIIAFGSGFSPSLPASTSTVTSALLSTNLSSPRNTNPAQLAAYNSLRVEARSTFLESSAPQELVTFSNLTFTSPSILLGNGSFTDGATTTNTPGTVEVVGGTTNTSAVGITYQRLLATTNLNAVNWTFAGVVTLARSGAAANNSEGLYFAVFGQNVGFAIPEPGSAVALLGALGAVLPRRRRRA